MAQNVEFRFRCRGARSVALAGDFNSWEPHPTAYEPRLDEWRLSLTLEAGRYEYKFLVDGRDWWNDPNAPTVPNVWGSENSYIDVA